MSELTIYEKLSNVQNALKAPKNQYNKFGNYSYRSCEDILEAVKPLLKEQGLLLTIDDEVMTLGERYYIKAAATVLDIKSGEGITKTAYAREAMSKKGMDESQVTGATSSYARKYALNGLFCIDDNKDMDSGELQEERKNRMNAARKQTQPKAAPANPTAEQPPQVGLGEIDDADVTNLLVLAAQKNVSRSNLINSVGRNYGKSDFKELTKKEYDKIVNSLERM